MQVQVSFDSVDGFIDYNGSYFFLRVLKLTLDYSQW